MEANTKNLKTVRDYNKLLIELQKLPPEESYHIYRYLCRTDLFFLLYWGCGRTDIGRQWLLDRCKEVQEHPNGYIDLWARDHYKSTIITYGKTIQDILASHGEDPLPQWEGIEPAFGIFSFNRPIAKGFLYQIKKTFEENTVLRDLFPDIIWDNPKKEASPWSEEAIILKRKKVGGKEKTVEAWGVYEGQPIGKHFQVMIYDDIVTMDTVATPEMIEKTMLRWENSLNLGSSAGFIYRYIGTHYHFNDPYTQMIEREVAIPRIYTATDNGKPDGKPVLIPQEVLDAKKKSMGAHTFSCQMLLNPIEEGKQTFKSDWLRFHDLESGDGMNIYILCDPANDKKKYSDYTVFMVVGLNSDGNYYVLDMIRDRLSLTERADALFRLHRKWRPKGIGYERYGIQADIQHFQYKMKSDNYRFELREVGGKVSKVDRIKGLQSKFESGNMYLPEILPYRDVEGKMVELTEIFIKHEYLTFPVSKHDDMLDCLARILDKDFSVVWPRIPAEQVPRDRYRRRRAGQRGSFMSM